MGSTLLDDEVVCADDSRCDYFPNPDTGPGTDLSDFVGEDADGDWRFCVGDGEALDVGTLDLVRLTVRS